MGQPAKKLNGNKPEFNALTFKAKLQRFLYSIGDKNNQPPADGTATDHALHQLMIEDDARSYFEKAYKTHLANVIEVFHLDPNQVQEGATGILAESKYYQLQLQRTNPSSKFDKKKFIAELRKHGVDADTITECEKAATTSQAGQKRYKVIPR